MVSLQAELPVVGRLWSPAWPGSCELRCFVCRAGHGLSAQGSGRGGDSRSSSCPPTVHGYLPRQAVLGKLSHFCACSESEFGIQLVCDVPAQRFSKPRSESASHLTADPKSNLLFLASAECFSENPGSLLYILDFSCLVF